MSEAYSRPSAAKPRLTLFRGAAAPPHYLAAKPRLAPPPDGVQNLLEEGRKGAEKSGTLQG
jgi:hypothetical protein